MNFFRKILGKKAWVIILIFATTAYTTPQPDFLPYVDTAEQADSASDSTGDDTSLNADPEIMFHYQFAGKCLAYLINKDIVRYGSFSLSPSYLIDYASYGAGLWHHKFPLRKIAPILIKQAAFMHMHDELSHAYGFQLTCLENHSILSFMAKTVASSLLLSMISHGYSTVFESAGK